MTVTLSRLAAKAGSTPAELRQLADAVDRGEQFEVYRARVRHRNRVIVWPDTPYDTALKQVRPALETLLSYSAPAHVYGFVKRRSTRQNAAQHLAADCVLTLDLQNFFPSIARAEVVTALRAHDADDEVAEVIGRLTTPRGTLGMGLSTSPLLSNLVFLPTDHALDAAAKELGLNFTRYVDDLTFSGKLNDAVADKLRTVLDEHGWLVNERKTRFMRRGRSQYVTGLSVADPARPHAPRRLKRRMRWRLNMIERYGFDAYLVKFGGGARGHEAERLRGLAQYIASIEPTLKGAWLERWYRAVPTTSHGPSGGDDIPGVIELDEQDIRRMLEGEGL